MSNQLEPHTVPELFDLGLQALQPHFLPGRGGIVVLLDEVPRQRVELRLLLAGSAVVFSEELTNVQEGHDQEVEGIETGFLHRKATVAVGGISAFHLNPNLSHFVAFGLVPGIRVNADQVVSLVVRRCLEAPD